MLWAKYKGKKGTRESHKETIMKEKKEIRNIIESVEEKRK